VSPCATALPIRPTSFSRTASSFLTASSATITAVATTLTTAAATPPTSAPSFTTIAFYSTETAAAVAAPSLSVSESAVPTKAAAIFTSSTSTALAGYCSWALPTPATIAAEPCATRSSGYGFAWGHFCRKRGRARSDRWILFNFWYRRACSLPSATGSQTWRLAESGTCI